MLLWEFHSQNVRGVAWRLTLVDVRVAHHRAVISNIRPPLVMAVSVSIRYLRLTGVTLRWN